MTFKAFSNTIIAILLFGVSNTLLGQDKIYSFQEVDTLPTFQDCPTSSKSEIDNWINCFYPKIEKLVGDSISTMEKQLGMEFSGMIKVQFVIDSNGAIGNAEISNKPHPILKKGAKDVLNSIKGLKPAKFNGQAVSMSLTMEVNYKLAANNDDVASEKDSKIYKIKDYRNLVVDEIPHLPECSSKLTALKKAGCNTRQLYDKYALIYGYPPIARETGIKGKVIVSLLIEPDGHVSKVKLEKDIGGGCGQAVLAALQSEVTNGVKWIPAIKDAKPVRSKFYYVTVFTLE